MEKKRVLVVALFELTQLYHELSVSLKDNVEFYWIATDIKYYNWLLSNGVDSNSILLLNFDKNLIVDHKNLKAKLRDVEDSSDITFNQAIMMDRFLMEEIGLDVTPYVYETFSLLDQFIVRIKPSVAFFEPTNITDILLYMLSGYYDIPILYPADLRYPSNRVGFFQGYKQRVLVGGGADNSNDSTGLELITKFKDNFSTPYSYSVLNKRNSFNIKVFLNKVFRNLPEFFKRSEKVSLTEYNLKKRFYEYFLFRFRSLYMRSIMEVVELNDIEGKVAYYPLHVQPESSIDVLGSYFSEQIKFIKDLRRTLPVDYTLLVKEHPNFVGSKPLSFFKELSKLPGVKLLSYTVNAAEVINRSNLVITISGTSAYQAALLGIPSATFSTMYFDSFSTVRNCSSMKDLRDFIKSIEAGLVQDIVHDASVLDSIIESSYDGYWTDVAFDDSVLDPKNIKKLSEAMLNVIYET